MSDLIGGSALIEAISSCELPLNIISDREVECWMEGSQLMIYGG